MLAIQNQMKDTKLYGSNLEAFHQTRRLAQMNSKVVLLHSFRVWSYVFPTRFECSLSSSPPVLSVFFQPMLDKFLEIQSWFLTRDVTDKVITHSTLFGSKKDLTTETGDLLHSFRVYFRVFSTRFDFNFESSPPFFECSFQESGRSVISMKSKNNFLRT
jgi:hypothetical protein